MEVEEKAETSRISTNPRPVLRLELLEGQGGLGRCGPRLQELTGERSLLQRLGLFQKCRLLLMIKVNSRCGCHLCLFLGPRDSSGLPSGDSCRLSKQCEDQNGVAPHQQLTTACVRFRNHKTKTNNGKTIVHQQHSTHEPGQFASVSSHAAEGENEPMKTGQPAL